MPIYEYTCSKCGTRFEHLARSFSESAPPCPECGAENPRKELSVFAAVEGGSSPVPASCPTCDTGTCPTGVCSTGTCPL